MTQPYSIASSTSALSILRILSSRAALGRSYSSRVYFRKLHHALRSVCVCVCVFFPFILDIKFVGRTSRGHTGGRSHRISHPPSFCGAREGFRYSFPSSTVKSNFCVVVVVVDSHIQRIVLATEETTVTQQVSHRPIKRQSRLWSQRGTKVNGSHHGDNPLLRPTGIQIATKSYAALQAMAPTNIKTVHQTSLLHSRATSIDSECRRLPTTSVLSKKPEKLRSNQF